MTPDGPEAGTTPAIPAQRAPADPPQQTGGASAGRTGAAGAGGGPQPGSWAAADPPPVGWTPALEPHPAAVRRGRVRSVVVASVAASAVLLAGLVVLRPDAKRGVAADAAPGTRLASAPAAVVSDYDRAVQALRDQSAALLRGDEAAWLGAVDPARAALRTRYRNMFRSLRALGVTRFDYRPGVEQPVRGDPGAVGLRVDTLFCFGSQMCPADAGSEWGRPPHLAHRLTLRPAGGRFVISEVAAGSDPDTRQPLPWENGELRFAHGDRVVVAAPPGQASRLSTVLKAADAAAAVDDRYATLLGVPQRRYRIFLAGEKQWRSWYGGEDNEWAIGLAVPLNMHGIDVVLRMKEMTSPLLLRLTLQHELAHVVTLTGAYRADAEEDTWLSEGVAEYIGWQPGSAVQSLRRSSVRWALHRSRPPTSMVPQPPGRNASDRAGDAFYGLSHLAAGCMAAKYGEPKLFAFVKLVLTADNEYDQAAREAFGVPFATVDRACLKWIRQRVG
jgi:hypothetical protein